MIKNKSIDDILEERLEEWAEWIRTGNFIGIGYPRQSTLERIRTGEIIDHSQAYQPQIQTNENAEEMEKYICGMAEYKPVMAQALRMYYMDKLSLRNNAKKLGVSYNQFKLYIQMGKHWLLGRLNTVF
jgi:hypothetical protein